MPNLAQRPPAAAFDEAKHPRGPGGKWASLDWDGLDRVIEHEFHPTPLDAPRVKHPRSGYMVEAGISRRVTRPPHTEHGNESLGAEGPATFTLKDHGDPLKPSYNSLAYMLGKPAGTEPIRHVYRGMSDAEWTQARKRGYIQSDKRGTISPLEGTNAAVDPASAVSYLPGGNSEGVVAKIAVRPEDKWFTIGADEYLRTRQPVPLDRVEHVVQFRKTGKYDELETTAPIPPAVPAKVAAGAVLLVIPDTTAVGPHGFSHGWKFEGVPSGPGGGPAPGSFAHIRSIENLADTIDGDARRAGVASATTTAAALRNVARHVGARQIPAAKIHADMALKAARQEKVGGAALGQIRAIAASLDHVPKGTLPEVGFGVHRPGQVAPLSLQPHGLGYNPRRARADAASGKPPAPRAYQVKEHHHNCPADRPFATVGPDGNAIKCHKTAAQAQDLALTMNFPDATPVTPGAAMQIGAAKGGKGNQGNAQTLRDYWTRGEGAAKIAWGAPGDFDRCVAEVGKYMDDPKGYCAERHHEALGIWPATHAKEIREGTGGGKKAAALRPAAAWTSSLHPRVPAGGPGGGEFGSGATGATPTNAAPVQQGMNGQQIRDLQTRLNALGAKLAVDGAFGPKTLAAVRAYQAAHGLKVDGLVGPKTTAALRLKVQKTTKKTTAKKTAVKKTPAKKAPANKPPVGKSGKAVPVTYPHAAARRPAEVSAFSLSELRDKAGKWSKGGGGDGGGKDDGAKAAYSAKWSKLADDIHATRQQTMGAHPAVHYAENAEHYARAEAESPGSADKNGRAAMDSLAMAATTRGIDTPGMKAAHDRLTAHLATARGLDMTRHKLSNLIPEGGEGKPLEPGSAAKRWARDARRMAYKPGSATPVPALRNPLIPYGAAARPGVLVMDLTAKGPGGWSHGWIRDGSGAADDLKRGLSHGAAANVRDHLDKAWKAHQAGQHSLAQDHLLAAHNSATYGGTAPRLKAAIRSAIADVSKSRRHLADVPGAGRHISRREGGGFADAFGHGGGKVRQRAKPPPGPFGRNLSKREAHGFAQMFAAGEPVSPPGLPPLVTIPGVDLLAAGTWHLSTGRQTFTRTDLADAADAAKCPAVGPPVIKIGHLDPRFAPQPGQDGEPAIGRVTNIRVTENGAKLTGDLAGMPGWLGAIAASAFPRRSVEGKFGFKCQIGHQHKFVLTALALLGLTPPGVGVLSNLTDIAALYGVNPPTTTTAATAAAGTWRTPPT